MEDKHIVTIDLGTEKLGISVATIDENRNISLSYYNEFPSDGIKHSKLSNPSRLAVKLKEALSLVEKAMGIRISEVMVNVQRYGVRQIDCKMSATTSNGNVSEADLELMDSMVWENREPLAADEEIIGCVAQSYDLDNGEINVSPEDVVGMLSDNITGRYKVYALRQSSINVIDNAFRDTGIITVRKVFVPDYAGACILTDNERQGGVALFDLGAGASSVSIFAGGVLKHYGAIPFGGANITFDIANVCGISEKLAENIKMAYGGCMPDRLGTLGEKKLRITSTLDKSTREVSVKYLSEIISARQKEIVDALLYEIQTSGYADKLKNGIIVTGGAASMLNVCNYIKEISGFNTKTGATSRNLFRSEDSSFFTLSASASSGLLRKYSTTETGGCEPLPAEPEPVAAQQAAEEAVQAPSAPVQEPEPSAEHLFEQPDSAEGRRKNSPIGNIFGIFGRNVNKTEESAPKPKKEKTNKKKDYDDAPLGGLFSFGEDEEV